MPVPKIVAGGYCRAALNHRSVISGRPGWLGATVCTLALGSCSDAGAAPLPSGSAPASSRFTALSYNIHGLPFFITGDDTLARLREIAPRLAAYEVVGLQEDFIDRGHALLMGAATHRTRLRFDGTGSHRLFGSGLTLLARARAVTHHHEHYEHCNGRLDGASDCFATKGLQMVRLQLAPGAEVDVYNSHLEAGREPADVAARAANVAQIIAAMQKLSDGRAIVFLGDTNLRPDDPGDLAQIQQWLERLSLRDACAEVGCPEPDHVDRVYLRDGAGLRLSASSWSNESSAFLDDEGTALSDHPPIVVRVRWQKLPP